MYSAPYKHESPARCAGREKISFVEDGRHQSSYFRRFGTWKQVHAGGRPRELVLPALGAGRREHGRRASSRA